MKLNKVYFITNIFPHYREALWREILSNTNFYATFYCSKNNPLSIKEGKLENDSLNLRLKLLKVIGFSINI